MLWPEQIATVQLTKADSNPANDWDNAVVAAYVTCAAPDGFGTGTKSCAVGTVWMQVWMQPVCRR